MRQFKEILFVVESGATCKLTLERAVALAEENQAKLTVIDFVERVAASIKRPRGGLPSAGSQAALSSDSEQNLETLIRPYRKRITIQTKVRHGKPYLEIIREVLSNGHDLVIKRPEPHHWQNYLSGSTDIHLLRKCPCPVWLDKPSATKASFRILAAVDVIDMCSLKAHKLRQDLSLKVLEMASSLASCKLAELHIMHAWELTGESLMRGAFINMSEEKVLAEVEQVKQEHKIWFDELLREMPIKLGHGNTSCPEPQTYLVKGSALKEVLALANQIKADLVVLGTVCHTGLAGFCIGNPAERVLNQIDCSLLTIKPTGFVAPAR